MSFAKTSRPSVALAILVLASSLQAQGSVPRPEGWPDAATVLARFKAGDDRHVSRASIGMCAEENPYGRTLWDALLSESPTTKLTRRLAIAWGRALSECGDPRIGVWYRARLDQYRNDRVLVSALSAPLRSVPTQENMAALKRVLFDDSVNEELRSVELIALDQHWSGQKRVDLYYEVFDRTERMPEPYGIDRFWTLIHGDAGDHFVRGSLERIEQQPQRYNAAQLLLRLATNPAVERRREWRSLVEDALTRVETNASGRYPTRLVETARYGHEHLRAATIRR